MYKQKSNPFNAPILKVDMEEGVVGTANKDGTIHVNKDVTDPDKIKDIVAHESVHLDQMKRGDLDYTDDKVIWKGKEYSRDDMQEGAKNLPWEKEAYKRQDEFKGDKSNPYESFQSKGLISPLNKKEPEVVKRTKLEFNPIEMPDLYTQSDRDYVSQQNEIQKTKARSGGFVGQYDIPTSTVGNRPSGQDLSDERSLTYNLPGLETGLNSELPGDASADAGKGRWILQSDLGEANVKAYGDDSNFEYRDQTFGDDYSVPGFYNVKTNERAPEKDNSKSLANNRLLQPSSFNVYSNEGNVNRPKNSYTTNYKLADKQRVQGDITFAEGIQSQAVLKGSKTRENFKGNKNILGKEKSFNKARFRSGAKAKIQKTILPKRKEYFDTYYDKNTNEVVTTKQKKFDRKVYNEKDEFYRGNYGLKGGVARTYNNREDFQKAQQDYAKTQEMQRQKYKQQEEDITQLRKFYNE